MLKSVDRLGVDAEPSLETARARLRKVAHYLEDLAPLRGLPNVPGSS
jgi:hypothetical protein